MKEKSLWPLLICATTVILVLAACTTANTSSPVPARTQTSSITPAPQSTAAVSERPQYGGTLNVISLLDIGVFDPVATGQFIGPTGWLTNEQYLAEDWTRGSAGSGEIDWVPNTGPAPNTCTAVLAESWQMPELGRIVFKVRRGVHWAINPNSEASRLMNGREVTAEDWISNFNYLMHHPRSLIKSVPQLASTATMEKTGPWEVTLRTPVEPLMGWNWFAYGTAIYFLLPPEVVQKYGDMRDWRNVVGTGPFMLADYIQGSSATLVKNPDYWGEDPVGSGKGNRLPYLDGVKILVITDVSTNLAALRSGKIDMANGIQAEDAKSMLKSIGDLKDRTYLPLYSTVVAMRLDKSDLPYKDKRVRQALMMATDFDALKNDFYGGDAEIRAYPVTKESRDAYLSLQQMPQSAQALYQHNPDRARQLLAEAGYPDGFKARMIVFNGLGSIDLASVYKEMWAKAGISLELVPREPAVYSSISYSRAYEDMILAHLAGGTQYPGCLSLPYIGGPANYFYISDPSIPAAREEIQKHVIVDMPEANRLFRETQPYLVEQAYFIPAPTPNVYSLWWPWLKNCYGETPVRFAAYYWIDGDVKEELTGRR